MCAKKPCKCSNLDFEYIGDRDQELVLLPQIELWPWELRDVSQTFLIERQQHPGNSIEISSTPAILTDDNEALIAIP